MSDLLEIGDRIVALAKPGEQVEVVVGRSTSTEVRVYEGEVEQLAQGARCPLEGRVGHPVHGDLVGLVALTGGGDLGGGVGVAEGHSR